MFYILSPSLLKAGKVYIAETPLYEMTYKKETKFAFDDNEKEQVMQYFKSLGAKDGQVKIQRSKGLGENDPEMMSISTMKPETRRLVPVEYPENDSELRGYFNALLGDDLETRRILLEENIDEPLFFLINSYTTGLQPAVLSYMLNTEIVSKFGGSVDAQEIGLPVSCNGLVLPCGASGRWSMSEGGTHRRWGDSL